MLQGIIDRLQEYFRVKTELIKLEVMARVAKLLSHVIVFAALGFFGLFMFFFFSFAFGAFLNETLQSQYLGHLIIGGIYLLIFVILGLLARSGAIQNMLESLIIKLNEKIQKEEDE